MLSILLFPPSIIHFGLSVQSIAGEQSRTRTQSIFVCNLNHKLQIIAQVWTLHR